MKAIIFSLTSLEPVANDDQLDTTSFKQLIFVFTTKYPFCCKETLPMWKSLVDSATHKKSFPVLGICFDPLEGTKAYGNQNKLTFPELYSGVVEILLDELMG